MPDFVAGLPPWLKYIVITWIPWIELRGALPLAIQQGERLYLPLILLANAAIYWPGYYFLEFMYERFPEGGWIHRKLEGIRAKAHPLVEKYGVLGLAVFVAIPLPGTGAYAGTAAAWLLDMDKKRGFLAVSLGVLGAFGLVWGASELVAALSPLLAVERLRITGTPLPVGLSYVPISALGPLIGAPRSPSHDLVDACAEVRASFAFVPAEATWCADTIAALGDASVAPLMSIGGPLWPVIEARGAAEGLRSTLTQPDQIGVELDRRLDGLITQVARGARLGARGIVLAEDLAGSHGPLVAPDFAIAELMPRYERVVRAARSLGLPAVFHSDGDVRPVLPAIARAGFVAIHGGGGLEYPAFERFFRAARDAGLAVVGGLLTAELASAPLAEAIGSKVGLLAKAGGLFVADDGGITTAAEVASLRTALAAMRAV